MFPENFPSFCFIPTSPGLITVQLDNNNSDKNSALKYFIVQIVKVNITFKYNSNTFVNAFKMITISYKFIGKFYISFIYFQDVMLVF